ncbi:lysophospholipid acyltransferase family protein [Leisingera aquaemixtae]|uniref:lysophospholipid acyltransferase family protein n=1 Tax=Leisingera aquaemixtae TaxID=1396826 RepID=UPI001C946BF2|nr:lysophospholipid acyltransferase family protein [Leisingera aquaemixtae]MBY6065842.1 lysophospholipid acyltransferase family protein [Leisingera aquaemixtae]
MPADPSELSALSHARYFGSNLFLRGLLLAAGLVPYRLRVPMMGRLVTAMGRLAGFDKRVRDNLKLVSPELSDLDPSALYRDVSDNAGRMIAEIYAGKPFHDRAKAAPITGPGLQALEDARAAGRPVLLATAHFGNYDAARAALVARGHEMGALYRRMANPYFNEHYVEAIKKNGEPMFEQGKRGMVELVRHLKKGGIAAIVTDLHAQGGKPIDFFGKPAVTSTVPAELALKFGAALIPVYAVRQDNGLDFEIIMNAEIAPSDPLTMTKALSADLESIVRKHAGQWFWIHRRWKFRKRKSKSGQRAKQASDTA